MALAAYRPGDSLVVTKLDRLARSEPDARDIDDELTARGVRLNLGGSIHDPADPVGRLLFTVLSMIAEFEADLARARTREGMAVAKAKGRLRGKQPSYAAGASRRQVGSASHERVVPAPVQREPPATRVGRSARGGTTGGTNEVGDHQQLLRLHATGPQEWLSCLNGRLEHLRGSALGFRNLTN